MLFVQPVSDLHRDIRPEHGYDPNPFADVLVLAGDIGHGADEIDWIAQQPARHKIYVPGNHESYGSDLLETRLLQKQLGAVKGVHVLDNDIVDIGGVRFIGTTLWSDFSVVSRNAEPVSPSRRRERRAEMMASAALRINDYRCIYLGKRRLEPRDTLAFHFQAVRFLNRALRAAQADGKVAVVVTHHGPTPLSIHPRWDGHPINGVFSSDLTRLIERYQPRLWIHGHTHSSIDYRIGATRVIANPHGYSRQENPEFDPGLLLDLDRL